MAYLTRSARLTRRGTSLLVVGGASVIGAYILSKPELLYVGALAILLPVIAIAFARFRHVNLTVDRTFRPGVVAVDRPAMVELMIANTAPLPTPELSWRDFRPWASGPDSTRTLPSLAAHRGRFSAPENQARVRYELVAPRRGEYEIGPLSVVLADPFGFATGEVAVGQTDELVVTPDLPVLPDTGLAILASDGSSTLVRRAIGGDDDLSTREYRTGDAMRRVHWRATARQGELMVRQEEPRSHVEARVILDTRRSGYADHIVHRRNETESESFELALSLAASIALHLSSGGFEVEFIETGRPQLEPVAPLEPFLRSLATISLSRDSGDYRSDSALQASSRPDRAHGSVFAILADADPATVDRLIAQRPGFSLAVAIVLTWRDSAPLDRLRNSGWTCVPVRLDDTVEDAWRAVAEMHEVRHGR